MRNKIKKADRIVIKVGTSSLTYGNGKVNIGSIEKLARKLADLSNMGREIILVTSGAVGIGMGKLNIEKRPAEVTERQAIAAVGQTELMHLYSRLFSEYGVTVGQILLTRDVFAHGTSKVNAQNTFESLLKKKIIPIVNENDSVSTEELEFDENSTFSENDMLAALVSVLTGADLLIILSDQDGFYTGDPRKDNTAVILESVTDINGEIQRFAGGNGTAYGTGGMITKLNAAKVCMENNVSVVIANGSNMDNIEGIIKGEKIGTLFVGKV
ncbi:MAG TPA: glutamate 5-kinase [Clostridia bacterium]|nr:glutamate 5-kinase [Clostridia bacterium]HRX41432.1 glutamate 5-kinase [Clostridia bacterium]